jgi:hypothetical protein
MQAVSLESRDLQRPGKWDEERKKKKKKKARTGKKELENWISSSLDVYTCVETMTNVALCPLGRPLLTR